MEPCTLHRPSLPAAPGIFFVFRDILQPLIDFVADRGRLPTGAELPEADIQAAVSRLDEFLAKDANSAQALWLVFISVAGPTTIPREDHERLAGFVAETLSEQHAAWKPRLTAALHYRAGEYQQAADLFDQNPKGSNWPAFQFLAAMAHHRLGNHDQARKLFDEADAWIQEQEDKEPGPSVPVDQDWSNWVVYKVLEREAAALVGGEGSQQEAD